ncbi:TonB-dependent receptor plug domain-containing protein [Oligoflexus tunisiensis]|uniref:TonB-dependent receptor plug domain-containing protein n=1 Tax=Oligoflexus tunisiensis TaxID=708132 RepID=UPI00159EFD3D|nr:TonB-dependent receptor [Oligoflexus tunisiensis]
MGHHRKSRYRFEPISISLLAALCAVSFEISAQGQQPDPAAEQPTAPAPAASTPATTSDAKADEAPKNKERITVTGSRIKQIELEGPKPVITIDSAEIKKSGATNVNDYLEKLTTASFGSTSYGSGYGAPAGTQGYNIHGLGSSNTLVLLNGRRLVRDPYLEIIDLSIIPTAAVEKIEILTGTASAIYGTDAAAGVVNIITRQDFDGMAFGYGKTKSHYTGGGDHDQAYVIAGTASDRSTNIITFQWDEDRGQGIGNRPWVDKSYRSIFGYPFSYYGTDNGFHPGSDCDAQRVLGKNTFCSYNYMDEWRLSGPIQKLSVLDDFSYQVTDNTKVGVRLFATRKTARSRGIPEPIDESSDGFMVSQAAIDANHPELNNKPVAPNYMPNDDRGGEAGVYVHGRLVAAPGSATRTEQLTTSGTASLTHDFDNGDQLEFSFSESRISRTHHWLNRWDEQRLSDAIWTGEYDVFAVPPAGGLDAYRLNAADTNESLARSAEIIYSGSFDIGARNFGYAAGISQIRESYLNEASANKVNGLIKGLGGGGGSGERKANAIFTELKVPIVSTLEASVAARYDDYTDFGDAFNPALGLQYRIGTEWFFRANYGTGFKAPSLRDVHDSTNTYYTSATDHLKCQQAQAAGNATDIQTYCEFTVSGTILSGGNPDLKPETSENWNVFIGFEPITGYGLNLQYYRSEIEDGIGSVSAEQLTKMEANGIALPTGTAIIRNPVTGDITGFLSPTTNLSTVRTSGLDVRAYASEKFGFGTLSFRTDYAYVLNYETQELPGGPFQKQLEIYGPRWKWNNSFGYAYDIHDVTVTSRTQSRIFKAVQSYGYIGAYTSWELNYGLEVSENAKINVGGDNIFRQLPNQDDSDSVFRGSGADTTYYAKVDFRI